MERAGALGLRVKPELRDLEVYKPGKPIEEVKRELGLREVVKLASNENPFGPSPRALEALMEALPNINRYPEGGCYYLRKRLSEKLGVGEDRLIFGNGSDELIVMAIRAFADKGDEILTATPTFLIYRIAAKAEGLKVKEVPLRGYRYDLEAMASQIGPRTRLIFISNPNNPTGTYVSKGEVEAFLDSVPSDCLVFFDEAYFEYAHRDGGDYPDSLQYQARGNIITARTFSKIHGLAGLRIGYAVSSPEVIELMNKVREPFNVNSLAQVAALAALDDEEYLAWVREMTEAGKSQLYRGLEELGIAYVPSAANFVLIELGPKAKEICDELLRAGIVVRYMGPWGLPGHARVTVGRREENEAFLRELGAAIRRAEAGGGS
ncbi:MAG: histidinol-phosphate transaminase [Candidatus Bathyarchaeia archaeon]